MGQRIYCGYQEMINLTYISLDFRVGPGFLQYPSWSIFKSLCESIVAVELAMLYDKRLVTNR